ncbi:MAG TPA: M28 family peptidase [Gemmatimonadaceae bacterium]|nr:M28 family peptidase [Gemmatimonadaceae bacterium]
MRVPLSLAFLCIAPVASAQQPPRDDVARLVAAMLGDTPLVSDIRALSDRLGGRATGSPQNLRAVEWGLERFREMGVEARREGFQMPGLWLERSATVVISGPNIRFTPRVAAMPFSTATPSSGTSGPLLDAGVGAEEDYKRLGNSARGAFLLVETPELTDIAGLFKEYTDARPIEERANAAGAAGVIYVGSRPRDVLYRHNVWANLANTKPMLVIERDAGLRALRLLRSGVPLTITETIDIQSGGPYESYNVVGEIRGSTRPTEVVLLGAHLDAWDLGDGTLDNGANVSLVLDVARQIKRLGLRPARTIRFVLWNGEEQGLKGSLGYAKSHAAELDKHVVTLTYDIGCGRVIGFFTGGRPEVAAATTRLLAPVTGIGPFTQIDIPIVGTDNFDFMMEGVANLVANQESAQYGPNYHARSDTFDKCDTREVKLNAASAAALVYGFAQDDQTLPRQTRAQVEELIRTTDLRDQMVTFNVWTDWEQGKRGRSR